MRFTKTILSVFALILLLGLTSLAAQAVEKPEIKVQLGHSGDVNSVAFSPDGKYALSGSKDKTVKLWDVASGKEIRTFTGHTDVVSSVAFSPDGRYGLSGSQDGSIRLWNISTGKVIKDLLWEYHLIFSVVFSRDGRYILAGSGGDGDGEITLWDIESGKVIRTFKGHTDTVRSVAFSSDGRYVVSGSDDRTAKLWDASNGKELRTLKGHSKEVSSVAFSPNRKYVLTGSEDETMKLWEASSGKEIRTFKGHSGEVYSVAFSSNGKYILSGSYDESIKLWDVSNGKELRSYTSSNIYYQASIMSVSFSPDDKYALVGEISNVLILWELASGKEVRAFTGRSNDINSVVYSPDGRFAISGSEDDTLKIWEVVSGKEIRILKGEGLIMSAAFSPDGHYAVSGSTRGVLQLWDLDSGKELRKIAAHPAAFVTSVAFSPDGRYVLSGSRDKTVKLWDVTSGQMIQTFIGHSKDVNSVAFSPNGCYALSGSDDNTLKLWDIATGKELRKFSHSHFVEAVAFSPDGRFILSGSLDDTLKLWDVASGQELRTFKGHSEPIKTVAFSPDGRYALSGSWDGTIKLWDIANGNEVRTFAGHSNWVTSVTFSPNGEYILSGSQDGTTRLWDIATGKEIAQYIGFDNGEWVVMTPEGYFNASPNGAQYINVVQGMNVYSIDNFFDTYYRPDIVTARIQGQNTSTLAATSLTQGFKSPPQIKISVKTKDGSFRDLSTVLTSDYLVENGSIKVRITAQDSGGGIKGIRLFNNGKVVGENLRGIKLQATVQNNQLVQEFDVALTSGGNILKAVGFSDDMTESNPVTAEVTYTPSTPGASKPDMYVLAIGINEYQNSDYNLNYCVPDAQGFIQALQPKAGKIFGKVIVITLLNKDANRANVLQALAKIKSQAKPEDVFAFFYAGHGIALNIQRDGGGTETEFFYVLTGVTQMSNPAKAAANGLTGTELKKELADIKAGKQILFVDACNSGAFANQFAARGAAEENALVKLSRATGAVILASTNNEQSASEFPELKHGVFTYVVIEALSGKAALANGQITAASLIAYIEDQIPAITQKYKGKEQYPKTFFSGSDFPIGVN